MVREIVHDTFLLSRKAQPAASEDIAVAQDLLDTLEANRERCVGLAANMIGVNKSIIVFDNEGKAEEMFNPEIILKKEPYDAEEGCLSLSGVRQIKRYKKIKVRWYDRSFKVKIKTFTGFTAQIIQHEVDHCSGILI